MFLCREDETGYRLQKALVWVGPMVEPAKGTFIRQNTGR